MVRSESTRKVLCASRLKPPNARNGLRARILAFLLSGQAPKGSGLSYHAGTPQDPCEVSKAEQASLGQPESPNVVDHSWYTEFLIDPPNIQ
jgi:hypothetical protein